MRHRLFALASIHLLLALACGGEETPVPPECAPLGIVGGPPVTSLSRHLAAAPAWAKDYVGGGAKVSAGPPDTALPQIREAAGQLSRATAVAPDGGPLVCTFALAGEGVRTASLALGDGTMVAAVDGWPRPASFALSIPGFSQVGGVRIRSAVVRTECAGYDPFFLLAAGLPIPKCREQASSSVDATPAWSGGLQAEGVRCGAIPWATASEEADEALGRFSADVAAMCKVAARTPAEPSGVQMQRDAARSEAYVAAAWVGWADPRVAAAVAQLGRLSP